QRLAAHAVAPRVTKQADRRGHECCGVEPLQIGRVRELERSTGDVWTQRAVAAARDINEVALDGGRVPAAGCELRAAGERPIAQRLASPGILQPRLVLAERQFQPVIGSEVVPGV